MKTEGIIFPEADKVDYGPVEVADPEPGDVVVRTTHTVLSTGTDTRTLHGGQSPNFPLVPSYSSVGIVEEAVGDTGDIDEGDLVFAGAPKALTGITKCWGAQIRHCVKSAASVVPLDDERPAEEYVFTKVAAIALHGVRRSLSLPGDRVVVIGQGLIGQLHARIQAARGCHVVASDILPWRLERSEAGGVMRAINAREEDVEAVVNEMWPDGAQVAVEASARQEGLDLCAELLRTRRWNSDDRMPVLVIQASFMGQIELNCRTLFGKEYLLLNTRDTDPRDLYGAAQMIRTGALDVSDMITLRAEPEYAEQAIKELLEHPDEHFTCVFDW
jgi:2-desacetyl-2-hydroxyethyl bacteriochlorophyllide A dehydrogenase